jgi:hypothetical protein
MPLGGRRFELKMSLFEKILEVYNWNTSPHDRWVLHVWSIILSILAGYILGRYQ